MKSTSKKVWIDKTSNKCKLTNTGVAQKELKYTDGNTQKKKSKSYCI